MERVRRASEGGCGRTSLAMSASDAHAPAPQHRKGHRRQESMYAMTGLYSETAADDSGGDCGGSEDRGALPAPPPPPAIPHVKCHSRNPSSGLVDREKDKPHPAFPPPLEVIGDSRDCGILACRPWFIQQFASIKTFVLLLSFLVTLQQAVSSGYINSVITTIEKRFEIPSSLSGLVASSYEIGNVITVIFVSYLGSRRHIPVWIGVGALVMGIGSLVFMVPHFIAEPNSGISSANSSQDNICKGVSVREQDMGLGRLSSGLSSPPLAPHNNLRGDNCIQSTPSTFVPVLVFVVAQVLLGCGGSPLFTLGTTYIDDHVKSESASMYIGFMYSMAAFGPVLGFLLGAYLLSFHMDSFSSTLIEIDSEDHRWVGMWWGGFLLSGVLLIVVAIPFFSFPKVLTVEREKIRLGEKEAAAAGVSTAKAPTSSTPDSGYGKDIKDLPVSMLRLLCNPIYVVTCLGACMELVIVSGFVVFLPKYLETQFSLGKSQASVFTGSIAIPGACIGIFMGGCLLKRLELRPKGAVQFVLVSNTICLACYALLFFLGCDNVKMAGTTIPYYNSSSLTEPFQVNLTAACNFGCSCSTTDVAPVCGNNGLTYFSPCHAGCTAFSSRSNYTNCACVHGNISMLGGGPAGGPLHTVGDGTSAAASVAAREDFAEVTVVPVATAGPCNPPCTTIYPFLILLFFMTFIVAVTQMPLLMIVLRSVSEEERSFALGMQFVIFRLFGYIPAPILFGNLIDSTCILWKSTCGEKGGRCLLYDIEQFRYKYVGLCGGIKIIALAIFLVDWWLVRRKKSLEHCAPLDPHKDITGSIISLDKLFEEKPCVENMGGLISGLTSGGSSIIGTPLDCPGVIIQSDSFRDQNFKTRGQLQRNDSQYSQDSQTSKAGMGKNSRVLVASKHLRNDSKTIQLEARHQMFIDEQEKSGISHSRTSSHDLKHSRSNSKDFSIFPRSVSKDFHTHSRSGSRDFKVHSRSSSRDISLDQIKHLALKSVENLDLASVVHSKGFDEEAKKLLDTSNMVLRHRRTNSKDLKPVEGTKHKRNTSQHLQMDCPETEDNELLNKSIPDQTFTIPNVIYNDKTLPTSSDQSA